MTSATPGHVAGNWIEPFDMLCAYGHLLDMNRGENMTRYRHLRQFKGYWTFPGMFTQKPTVGLSSLRTMRHALVTHRTKDLTGYVNVLTVLFVTQGDESHHFNAQAGVGC